MISLYLTVNNFDISACKGVQFSNGITEPSALVYLIALFINKGLNFLPKLTLLCSLLVNFAAFLSIRCYPVVNGFLLVKHSLSGIIKRIFFFKCLRSRIDLSRRKLSQSNGKPRNSRRHHGIYISHSRLISRNLRRRSRLLSDLEILYSLDKRHNMSDHCSNFPSRPCRTHALNKRNYLIAVTGYPVKGVYKRRNALVRRKFRRFFNKLSKLLRKPFNSFRKLTVLHRLA